MWVTNRTRSSSRVMTGVGMCSYFITALTLFWSFGTGTSFVVVTDQSNAQAGWVLFDAHVKISGYGSENLDLSKELQNQSSTYAYRVSHHKTQPWAHRLVHFDTEGKLRLKRSLDACYNHQTLPRNSFLVYIDIFAHQPLFNGELGEGEPQIHLSQPPYQFDYISFPLLIIINPSLECSMSQVQGQGSLSEIRFHDREILHWSRSVDDIYVSLPVQGAFCHHSSEKIGNLNNFLPTTVQEKCKISATINSGDHFFAIESSTNDVVLKADFCLFEAYHTTEILLRLNCSVHESERVISWDQLVHFIVHRLGGSTLTGDGSTSNHLESHPIHRIRREMRNQAPFFDQALYKASVPEEQPAGITVTKIVASDPENSPISYSMTSLMDSRSQQFFALDPKSGIITTIEKLDREKMDVHYFRVVASDSGIPPRTGTATLEVNVQDINDFSPVFEQSSYSVSIREGLSVGSTVLSVRATDQDSGKNGEVFYSILNSHDIDDTFRIDSSTGVITTKLPLDREKRDEYTILVQANDLSQSQIDRRSTTTSVRVEILDENDSYPQFSQKSYSVTIAENFDVSNYPVIARVSATDADEGVNAALRYSIIGGNNQNHFSIDSLTGEVSLIKSLDYETTRSFRLNIRAIDSGKTSRSNNTVLNILVKDLNDNFPKFYQTIFQETVQENLPIGSKLLRIQAFDADSGDNAKILYRVSYRENPDKFPFEVETDSGWITTDRELDREEQSRYDFEVIAADSGDVPLSSTASVVIVLQDVNDNDPVFSPKIYETTVSEQDQPGTPVATVTATDPDEGARLTYEITEGNIRNRFSISTQNGEGRITIAQPLDFKSERKFVLTVKASDTGGKFDLATLYIDVLDSNGNAPVFQNTPYSVKIFEDVPVGTTIFTVLATDQDSGLNAQIVYTFLEDGENEGTEDFMIDSVTGAITTSKLLDREKVSGYILTVSARDKGIPPMSDTTDVEVVLNDVNDLKPVFEKDFYQAKVSEDVPVGSSILQVQASDGDQGKNSIVRYSFSTFSDGDGTFSVDAASGIIRTVKQLDRETVSRYELMVLATDQGSPELTGRTNVTITVLDINDSPPMFESDRIRFFIQENSPMGSTVGTIQAYDPDEGANAQVTYSIVGGLDANSFTLVTHPQPNGGSGSGTADILTKLELLDFESKRKKFDIIVRASSPPLWNDVNIDITLLDVNDNLPVVKNFEIILNNYKDHFPVGPIGRVPAFDADVTDQLQYSILSGNKANLVYLNESTGLLTLSPYLDTNVPLMAKIEILVSDGLNEARAEMVLNTRMITDDLLFNSVTLQLADMTTDAFLSPLYTQFVQALGVTLNSPKENIIVFSVQEEIEGSQALLNISFAARKPNTAAEEYYLPDYIRERVFLNRLILSKLSTVEVLPFSDDLCLLEPCPNFEDCLSVLRFRNVSNFVATDSMLFRSVFPWQTFACRCPSGFTGLREHYLCDAEINLCFSSPCSNGGTCFRRERGFSCACPPEFTGAQCEIQLTMDTCQPGICSRGSTCLPRVRGGFLCQNCSSRGDYVNGLCELTARSFSRGSYLTFPGLKNRYRLNLRMSFATHQRNGLLLYNGRYNERFDFIALEIVNSTVRYSFSLGSVNVTQVDTGKAVSDGFWHLVELRYFNKTATLSIDDCDVILSLQHPDEFPTSRSCAGRSSQVLEQRCEMLIESCQRFLDLTGPLYLGGLPAPFTSFQVEAHDFLGCIKDVYIDDKFLDLNNYVKEYGTAAGCPEKKNFCASQPCKNGGKCLDGWGTYRCTCPDGYGQKDCSEDAKPVWNLRDENSHLIFPPLLRQIQFPWFNSMSIRTLRRAGSLMQITMSNNDTISLHLENNGLIHYTLDGNVIPVTLPRVNDGLWHNIEVKWMTAEIWFSLDFGQYEITIPYEAKVQGLYVSEVIVGGIEGAFTGCVQDVRVGGSKSYLRKPTTEKNVNEGCSLATACIGAVCPPRSTCVEEAGKHKCSCDPGHVGVNCLPICELKPCRNNGTCVLDLTTPRGYQCKCDERFFRGKNCEEMLDLSCPSTWWNWPDCAPCSCPADKNFSPDCNRKTGQCKCKEYHYERDNTCADCMCYSVGSISKNCDLTSGRCQCRPGVSGNRCDSCSNPFAEVTLRGCEVVYDGCPRSFAKEIWWPRAKFGTTTVHDCPSGAIGLATRECLEPKGWDFADVFNCTSTSFISILNIISQLDSSDLALSPLLSTKLAGDLYKALNSSSHLYGNDLWISLRLLNHLIKHEADQKGLYLSHRQDKNFIKNLALSAGKITSKQYANDWDRIGSSYSYGSDTLLKIMDQYLAHLTLNQEDTYTKPFEIITRNLVLGLDTVEVTWENKDRKNFEDLQIQSSYDLYERSTVTKRAVRFPKYDNIVMDPRRYSPTAKVIVPLDILGLNEDKDMAGYAVVGYMEFNTIWEVLPKKFKNDVDRRFTSELIAYPPIISLSILASGIGIQKGKQNSPIRITYEVFGRYIDSSNPQCVMWEEPEDELTGGWTTRSCSTQAEESYVSHKMGNVIKVNCTCWHLSTFALLIENNAVQDIPRPALLEDIISYVAFVFALCLIFGALLALGLLKGPVPATITNTIHKHLLLCIFSALLLYVLGLKLRLILVQNDISCRILAIGLHFFWLSGFAWLFGSSLHLRRMFTEVRDVNHGSALFYFALGYAFPLLCVALSLGVRAHHYGNKFFCWLSLYEGIVWGMVGPILLCVVGSLITFLIAVRAAFTLKDSVIDSGSMRTLLWMDLTLLPICGMVWALCLLGANERSSLWQYAISAAVTLLSLYIALGYCILNQRVKDSLYIRAGNLFRAREDAHPSNISRSALAYRSDSGLRADDLRREMFRGTRSMGISTASTTSRSTTKTSSSPYRSDMFHTFGGGSPKIERRRFTRGLEAPDSPGKSFPKRRKRSSEEEGSSDGQHTLELASSHSSDEDEAIPASGHVRGATIDMKSGVGGRSSGNSGSDNENPNNSHAMAMPQEYSVPKVLNSSENLHMSHIEEPKYGEKLPYFYHQEPVNDLSGSAAMLASHHQISPSRGSPMGRHYDGHPSSTPMLPYHLTLLSRPTESPISPVQEMPDDALGLEQETSADALHGPAPGRGVENFAMEQEDEDGAGDDMYGGSMTSGVLV